MKYARPVMARVCWRNLAATLGLLLLPTMVAAQTSDTAPPQLRGFAFAPEAIDVSGGPATVTVTIWVTDDPAGVGPACCPVQFRFRSPTGGQTQDGNAAFSTGTPWDGTWTARISFPRFSEAGTWTVDYVSLRDQAGNTASLYAEDLRSKGFAAELDVVSNPSDTEPPQVAGFTVTPTMIDSSAGASTVAVALAVTDDLAGVGPACCPVQVRFQSPSGNQRQGGAAAFSSGTPLDGIWGATVVFPRLSEAGTWTVEYLSLRDLVGNGAYLHAEDLEALGLPTEITVIPQRS